MTAPELGYPAHELLEAAVGYALQAVAGTAPELMTQPTPCRGWDLGMLLRHGTESLAALAEGITSGQLSMVPQPEDGQAACHPAAAFRARAAALLRACDGAGRPHVIAIAGRCLTRDAVAGAGALEIAMHGWDISRACGRREPIPVPLAGMLLELSPVLVPCADRAPLFAAPVAIDATAGDSDRLAAFLGRDPAA
ncbi:MAG: maleylpyruvate isomerase N-terminal domain-containing protein [Actinomycetota bacterium]